jgi:hypothetical protein
VLDAPGPGRAEEDREQIVQLAAGGLAVWNALVAKIGRVVTAGPVPLLAF